MIKKVNKRRRAADTTSHWTSAGSLALLLRSIFSSSSSDASLSEAWEVCEEGTACFKDVSWGVFCKRALVYFKCFGETRRVWTCLNHSCQKAKRRFTITLTNTTKWLIQFFSLSKPSFRKKSQPLKIIHLHRQFSLFQMTKIIQFKVIIMLNVELIWFRWRRLFFGVWI